MSGIVEWLRGDHQLSQADREEAAAEIERLRADNKLLTERVLELELKEEQHHAFEKGTFAQDHLS